MVGLGACVGGRGVMDCDGLMLAYLMWFLHLSRETQLSPEGAYLINELDQLAAGLG